MRRKKHKNTRRTMRFYRINFGFRPPYKVIVDGNFVHVLESLKRGDAKDLIAKLLGDQVKVYTTRCIMHELRTMGKDMADTRQACKRYALHKCGHEEEHVSAADCLLAQLGDKNPEHFLIATQDRGLQRRVMSVPGGASIFASVNGVHLETPSALQKKQVKQVEAEHMSVNPQEKQSKALSALSEKGQQGHQGGGPAIRRKRAKGPNPLAMKPKQKKAKTQTQVQQGEGAVGSKVQQQQGGDAGKRKRTRRRKRGEGNDGTAAEEA